MNVTDIQAAVDQVRSGGLPPSELRRYLSHPSPLVRVNAMEVLAADGSDPGAVSALQAAATDRRNRVRLFGVITASDVAIAGLLRIGSEAAVRAASGLISATREPHRTDLLEHLRSEGLAYAPAVSPASR